MNILFSVHEISPNLGSECSSGWNIVLELSKYHNLTVLFAETNQFGTQNYFRQIEEYFEEKKHPPGLKFVPIKQPLVGKVIAKLNQAISSKASSIGFSSLYFLSYRLWQWEVYKRAKILCSENSFSIVHHFNSLSFREPGYLCRLNVPFIWGPISGLDNLPYGFFKNVPVSMLIKSLLRNISNYLQFTFSTRINLALKKAVCVYTVTAKDKSAISKKNKNVISLLDVGTNSQSTTPKFKSYNSDRKLKVLWVGRLDYLKALDILLFSIANSALLREYVDLYIVGTGPQLAYYKKIAKKTQIINIKWIGHVQKSEVEHLMAEADILVHTSIKEAASAVILESLQKGLPIVCHDSFGMAHSVTKACGIKVPFESTSLSIKGFQMALENIIKKPDSVKSFSEASIERSKELSWENMAKIISSDYCKYGSI